MSVADLQAVDDVRRQPLEIWGGKSAWVWGLTFRQFMALHREAQRQGPDGTLGFDPERYSICRVVECVKDSGAPDAKPIFKREEHYDWLRERSVGVIDRIVRLSMRLSGEAVDEAASPDPCCTPEPRTSPAG